MSLRASQSVLRISADVLELVWKHARADHPWEACGIITSADRHIPMLNASMRPHVAYVFNTVQYLATYQEMHANGETLKIIYHSHTGRDAMASGTDHALAATDAFYLIVSTHDDTTRAFRPLDGRLTECVLEVVPSISAA